MTDDNIPNAEARKSKILVCVSDNEHSLTALRFACSKAKSNDCILELVSVITPSDYQSFGGVEEKIRQEQREASEKLLNKFAEEAQEWEGVIPSLSVREGSVLNEIIAAIEEDSSINMLIVGTAHDSPSKDVLLPTLVSAIGDRLLIPMLIVPGTLTEQQIRSLA
jgi:nucleotide-binding universal stress UspA family protein